MWEAGESIPSVEIFLTSIEGASLQERAEAVVVDQRFRWKRGIEVSAEHYLHRCPDLDTDRDCRRMIVTTEFEVRGADAALLAEFAERFPDLKEDLASLVT